MKIRIDEHPLAINFKKLQRYDMKKASIDEITFFEWLILKQKIFGDENPFFYQNRRAMEEVGIKRSRLESIKSKFVDYGLIVEPKGILNTTHYHVQYEFISNYVDDHVLLQHREEYLNQITTINFRGIDQLSEDEYDKTTTLIDQLNELYNQRRHAYNRLNGEVLVLNVKMDYDNKTIYQLNKMRLKYNEDTIFTTFSSFIDALLDERDHTTHILNNFSSYDNHLDKFPVLSYYNRLYNESNPF